MRELYGEPDVIQIRQTFNDSLQAREWEEKVLRRLSVVKEDKWLNKNHSNGKFCCLGHSEETRQKMSYIRKGVSKSEETKKKMSEAQKGKTPSEETRKKIGESGKGKTVSEEARKMISATLRGRIFSEEHKQKMSATQTGKVLCLDIQTGIKARISSELFHSDKTRYFGLRSKVYKEYS